MIQGFPLRPAPMPQECAHDHLARLLQANGHGWLPNNRTMGPLLVGSFRRETARESLEAFGVRDADALLAKTPEATGRPRHVELAGEVVHRESWTLSRRRWCPECWREDLAGGTAGRLPFWGVHRRFWWSVTAVETCPVHRVRLAERCPECGGDVRWRSGSMLTCVGGHWLLAAEGERVRDDHVAADAYIVGRLGGAPRVRVPLLDGIDLADAVDAMQRFGIAAHDGPRGSLRELGPERRPEVMSTGLRIAADWPGSFKEMLAGMAGEWAPGNWGVTNLYGYLADWVRLLPDGDFAEEVRRVFYGEIVTHGHLLDRSLARKYAPKEFVTLLEAARRLRCSQATVRRYLEALGHLDPCRKQKGTPVNITLAALEELEGLFRGRINTGGVAGRLGVDHYHAVSFMEDGLLAADPVHDRCNGTERYFHESEVEVLLARLREGVPEVETRRGDLFELPRASQGANAGGLASVCRLILDGWLKPDAVAKDGVGLRAILTTVEAVREAHRRANGGVRTCREAAREMGMHLQSVYALTGAGLLESLTHEDGRTTVVTEQAMDDFRAEYVTSRELAAAVGTKSRYVTEVLRMAGVDPVADPEILPRYRGSLYRRTDVPDDLRARWEAAYPGRRVP